MSKLIQVQATTTGTYVDGSGNLVTVTGVISDATTAVEPSSLTITDRHTMTIVYPFNVITDGSVVADWDSNADVPDAVALTAANIELSYTSPIWFYDDTGKDCTYTKDSAIVLGDDSHATSFTDTAVTNNLTGQYLNYFDASVESHIEIPAITLSGDFYVKIYVTSSLNDYLMCDSAATSAILTTSGGELSIKIAGNSDGTTGLGLTNDNVLHLLELSRTSTTLTVDWDGVEVINATATGDFVLDTIGRSWIPGQYWEGFIGSITMWNNATGAGTAVREYLMSTDLSVAGDPITVPDTGSDGSDGSAYNIASAGNDTEQYTLNGSLTPDQYENRYWPNLLKYSNDPDSGDWTSVNLTSATNGDMVATAVSTSHYLYRTNPFTPIVETQYETFVLCKEGDQPELQIDIWSNTNLHIYVDFKLNDGTIRGSGDNWGGNLIGTPTIVASTEHSGYYECRFIWTVDTGTTLTTVYHRIFTQTSSGGQTFLGDASAVNTYIKNTQVSLLADADMVTTTDTNGKAIVVAY